MKFWILFAISAATATQHGSTLHQQELMRRELVSRELIRRELIRREPMKKFFQGMKISKLSKSGLQKQEGPTLPPDQKKDQSALRTIPDAVPHVRGSVTIVSGHRDKGDKNTYGFVRSGKVNKGTEFIGSRAGQHYAQDFSHADKLSIGVEPKKGDTVRASARAQQVKVKMDIPEGSKGMVSYRHNQGDQFTYEEYTHKDSPVRRVLRGQNGGTISGVGYLEGAGKIRTTGQMAEPAII